MSDAANKFFENVLQQNMLAKKHKQDTDVAVLDSLLQMEIQQMQADKLFLREQGLNLKDLDISDNFEDIIAITGNTDLSTRMNMMLDRATAANEAYGGLIADFHRGKKLAEQGLKQDAAYTGPSEGVPGETGKDVYLYSDEERDRLIEAEGITDVNDAFKLGFGQGSLTLEQAMKNVNEESIMHSAQMKINKEKLDLAEMDVIKNIDSIGRTITASMTAANVPVLMFGGANMPGDDNEAGRELYMNTVQAWQEDNEFIPNIKGDFMVGMDLYANPGQSADKHIGFVRMASNAYQAMVDNQSFIDEAINGVDGKPGFAATEQDAIKLMLDKESGYYNAEFHVNRVELSEAKAIGILTDPDTLQKAYITMGQLNAIEDGRILNAEKNARSMAEVTGLNYDEVANSLEILDKRNLETRFGAYADVANDAYTTHFGDSHFGGDYNIQDIDKDSDIQINTLGGEEVVEYLGAKGKVKALRSGGTIGKGESKITYNSSVRVEKEITDNAGVKTKTIVPDYRNASYTALTKEFRSLMGTQFDNFMSKIINDNPDVNRMGGIDIQFIQNYIPNPEEMVEIQNYIQNHVDRLVDPSSPSDYGQAPFQNIAQNLPGTSLIMGAIGGVREQGIEGAVSHRNEAIQLQQTWKYFKTRWNQLRDANNLKKISLSNLSIGL